MIVVPTSSPTITSYRAGDPSSLYLSWSSPPVNQQNGIIRYYNISLIELETGYIFSHTTMNTSITISQLHPHYRYQFEISAFTIGTGPSSIPIIVQMPEDGREYLVYKVLGGGLLYLPVLHCIAPSAPPGGISIDAIYFDSIYFSWSAPLQEHHNGEIIGYTVTFTVSNSGEVFDIFSASNSTIAGSLDPFTSYSITIAAVTRAGIGPDSAAVTVVTAEAGKVS